MTIPAARPNALLLAIVAAVAMFAIVLPLLVVLNPPRIPPPAIRHAALPRPRVVPPVELPPVEPLKLVDVTPDDARAINETVPFAKGPNPPARPFRLTGSAEDLARATDCLAAAAIYEAGDDAVGERAVVQVVLNRLRHPAYPKTVCGVVFQGQERTTGCQFTFTCDGAMMRTPSEAAWRRAREVASAALAGAVFKPVGWATHYHTDWVVPYWSSSLDKIARVDTHLFFRWTGWWGTPPAFNRSRVPGEPGIAKLALLSPTHRLAAGSGPARELAEAAALAGTTAPAPIATEENSFLVTLPASALAEDLPLLARRACGDRPYCKYLSWADARRTPTGLPLTPVQVASMSFSYLRDTAGGYEKALWNCQIFRRADPAQCMKVQVFLPEDDTVSAPASRGPVALDGVRRRGAPAPVPSPSPSGTPNPFRSMFSREPAATGGAE